MYQHAFCCLLHITSNTTPPPLCYQTTSSTSHHTIPQCVTCTDICFSFLFFRVILAVLVLKGVLVWLEARYAVYLIYIYTVYINLGQTITDQSGVYGNHTAVMPNSATVWEGGWEGQVTLMATRKTEKPFQPHDHYPAYWDPTPSSCQK